MKANDIRQKSAEELQSKLVDLKEELFNLRFQLAINQLDNPMQIKAVKKDIARVKTVLRDMELKEAAAKATEV
ncbi:MAG: 50S ribosomal protein L29 [Clostridia bacterium]|nr:50S ribosomal protein L29 [Clostridia bacterium]